MNIWDELKDLPQVLRKKFQQYMTERENEIISQERELSVIKATDAFLEAKVPRECIISLLQKHWDLRQSEAEKALWQAENRAKRG